MSLSLDQRVYRFEEIKPDLALTLRKAGFSNKHSTCDIDQINVTQSTDPIVWEGSSITHLFDDL
jgi:hypothetical protein